MHIFLVGLDGEFEQVRGEILRKDPIPELKVCYALVCRESVRHATMIEEPEKTEASAMVTRNRSNQNWSSPNQPKDANGTDKSSNKSSYKCTHCNQTGHTKSHCFELVGYPEWWDHSRDSRKRNSKKKTNGVAGQTSAIAATRSNGGKTLNISTLVSNSAWIIDSGATDHMTFDSRQVSPFKPSSQKSVSTANGSSASVIGEKSLSLTNTLNLDSVLVVPSLNYDLLSRFQNHHCFTLCCNFLA